MRADLPTTYPWFSMECRENMKKNKQHQFNLCNTNTSNKNNTCELTYELHIHDLLWNSGRIWKRINKHSFKLCNTDTSNKKLYARADLLTTYPWSSMECREKIKRTNKHQFNLCNIDTSSKNYTWELTYQLHIHDSVWNALSVWKRTCKHQFNLSNIDTSDIKIYMSANLHSIHPWFSTECNRSVKKNKQTFTQIVQYCK